MPTKKIYFLRPVGQRGPIKIGCSMEPTARLKHLAHWSPIPLELAGEVAGDHDVERRLHKMFAADRSHHEWFHPSAALEEIIARAAEGKSFADLLDMNIVLRPRRWVPRFRTAPPPAPQQGEAA